MTPGFSLLLLMASPMARALSPDSRKMPIPPVPGGVAIAAMVSCGGMARMWRWLSPAAGYLAPASMRLVITHCCAMDSTLLTTQYNTSPAGKKAKNMVKTNGSAIIILA